MRNVLWPKSCLKKEDKDSSCGWWHTGSGGNTSWDWSSSMDSQCTCTFPLVLPKCLSMYTCMYTYMYTHMYMCTYIFDMVLLNPYQFSNAINCGFTRQCFCSGEGITSKWEAGNEQLRPGKWELHKAELSLSLLHQQTMDLKPLIYWL